MPYLILPKDAPIPPAFTEPYIFRYYDRWEVVEGITGSPCPDCSKPLARDTYTFSLSYTYRCTLCGIRRLKCLAGDPPVTYPTRQLAHAACTPATERVEYVSSPAEREAWYARETSRRSLAPPIGDDQLRAFPRHYLHMSSTKPGLFAYTKDDEHGYLDKQTILKPGKYLTQYYADKLTTAQIADIVAACAAYATLGYSLATSTADITAIFNSAQGPSSCMQRREPAEYDWQKLLDREDLPYHPSAVYGESDLAIAYLGTIGNVSQRAVVWPAEKRYCNYDRVRIYGTGPLEQLLRRDGYTAHPDAFHGARIRQIPYRGGVLMPYIDGTETAYALDSKWLVLDERPEPDARAFGTTQTCGYAGARNVPDVEDENSDDVECSSCGGDFTADEIQHGECYDCRHSWTCEHCDSRISDDNGSWNVEDENWCESCADSDSAQCAECDEAYNASGFSHADRLARQAANTSDLCPNCAEHFSFCDECQAKWDTRESDDCPNEHATEDGTPIRATDDTDTLSLPYSIVCIPAIYCLEIWSATNRRFEPCYAANVRITGTWDFCSLHEQRLQALHPSYQYRIGQMPRLDVAEVSAHV